MKKTFPQGGLQRLIQERRGDRSYESLSRDCGGTPAKPNLQRLATDEYKSFPGAEAMIGLSKGLKVRLLDIVIASAISCGLPLRADESDDLVIPGAAVLPNDSQDMLRDMARQMLWWQEQVEIEKNHGAEKVLGEGSGEDNVTPLRSVPEPEWEKMPADKGESGIDPDQDPHES